MLSFPEYRITLKFDFLNFEFVWCLEFGAWNFIFSLANMGAGRKSAITDAVPVTA